MYDVDVNGTHNVLEAAAAAGTSQVLVTSSASAYGAFPDSPVPLTEDDPVRGVASFSYARDKTEADRICQLWAARYHERVMTIMRPSIVFGPNVDNSLVRLWTKQPFVVDVGQLENPIQFVHEDDLVEAISGLLLGRHAGAFNVAGEGLMTLAETYALIGTPVRRMPLRAYRALARAAWRLRASESPPGADRVLAVPLDRVDGEAQADARLDAPPHQPRELRDRDASAWQAAAGGPAPRCYSGRLARPGR